MSLNLAVRRARLLAVRDAILAHGDGAVWYLDGVIAPSPDAAISATPLAILVLTSGSFTLHPTAAEMLIESLGNASSSGQPTWVRFVDALGAGVLDRTAGPPGSGAQVIVTDDQDPPTAQIWTGGEIDFSHTLTDP